MSERAAFRVREVADQLGVSRSSVYKLIAEGDLACYRVARNTVRIGQHHLAAYLERAECPARELTENGPSNENQTGPSGTPTAGSTNIPSGFRSALRAKARLSERSRTSKPKLSVVESSQ
jgi:excisionase family DNA binding protein